MLCSRPEAPLRTLDAGWRRRLIRGLGVALLAISMLGCYRVSYRTQRPPNGVSYSKHDPFFLWGWVGHHTIDVQMTCPYGLAALDIEDSGLTWLLSVATLGLYSPLKSAS